MSIWEGALLGLIQGIAEFLPISSSGHLILAQKLMDIDPRFNMLVFDTLLHAGTLFAVILYFRRDILSLLKNPQSRLAKLLVIALIPTIIGGLLIKFLFPSVLEGLLLGGGFLITAVLLYCSEQCKKGKKRVKEMQPNNAFLIGTIQIAGLLPGISRSGVTIFGGLACGMDRSFAAKFSMLLSIPAILGSVALQSIDILQEGFGAQPWGAILAGMAAAAVSGYFAIRVLMHILAKSSLKFFAVYMFLLGTGTIIAQLSGISFVAVG